MLLAAYVPVAIGGCAGSVSAAEAEQIAELLAVAPGQRLADVGAGDGEWSVELARRVGPEGWVYATEIEQAMVEEIAERAAAAGLGNITAVLGGELETGLGAGCCDGVLLRLVYHHFTEPAAMRASLRAALKPGGRLVVVDIRPQESWRDLPEVPDRGGHGIEPAALVAEMIGDGFELLSLIETWNGDDERFAAVFRLAGGG